MEEHAGRYTTNQDDNMFKHISNNSTPWKVLDYSLRTFNFSKYSWRGWNKQAPSWCFTTIQTVCSCCVIQVSLQVEKVTLPLFFLFQKKKKQAQFPPQKSTSCSPRFPMRFHRLKSWTMSQYKNKALIYNNRTLSCHYLCTLVH